MRTKPKHLKAMLIGALLLMQLCSVLLILHGVSKQTRERLDDNARSSLARLSDAVAERAADFLMRAGEAPGVLASLVSRSLIDPDDVAVLTSLFLSQLERNANVENIYLGRENGSFLLATRVDGTDEFEIRQISIDASGRRTVGFRHVKSSGELVKELQPEGYDLDPRERPWYRLARENPGVAWTDPYTFYHSEVPGITATTVIRDSQGRTLGALGVDVRISELSRFVAEITPDGSASAAIVNSNNHIVAYSDHTGLAGNESFALPDHEHFAHTRLKMLLDLHEQGKLSNQEIVRTGEDDTERMAQIRLFNPLGQPLDGEWILVAQVPTSSYGGGLVESSNARVMKLICLLSLLTLLCVAGIVELVSPVVRMAENASIDSLTGIANRRGCLEHFDTRIMDRRRDDKTQHLVAVALDLDGFKPVNDLHGHATGDELLRQFVDRLRQQLRKDDLLARTGGDEFICSLTIDPDAKLLSVVDRIRRAVVETPFSINGDFHLLGVTAGIAQHSAGESTSSLLNRADTALVNGKRMGKNRCYLAEPFGLDPEALRWQSLDDSTIEELRVDRAPASGVDKTPV